MISSIEDICSEISNSTILPNNIAFDVLLLLFDRVGFTYTSIFREYDQDINKLWKYVYENLRKRYTISEEQFNEFKRFLSNLFDQMDFDILKGMDNKRLNELPSRPGAEIHYSSLNNLLNNIWIKIRGFKEEEIINTIENLNNIEKEHLDSYLEIVPSLIDQSEYDIDFRKCRYFDNFEVFLNKYNEVIQDNSSEEFSNLIVKMGLGSFKHIGYDLLVFKPHHYLTSSFLRTLKNKLDQDLELTPENEFIEPVIVAEQQYCVLCKRSFDEYPQFFNFPSCEVCAKDIIEDYLTRLNFL